MFIDCSDTCAFNPLKPEMYANIEKFSRSQKRLSFSYQETGLGKDTHISSTKSYSTFLWMLTDRQHKMNLRAAWICYVTNTVGQIIYRDVTYKRSNTGSAQIPFTEIPWCRNRDNVVGVVTRLRAEWYGVWNPVGAEILFLSKSFISAKSPKKSPIKNVQGQFSCRNKVTRLWCWPLTSISAEVRNGQMYNCHMPSWHLQGHK
jgi:hypothetical protein